MEDRVAICRDWEDWLARVQVLAGWGGGEDQELGFGFNIQQGS